MSAATTQVFNNADGASRPPESPSQSSFRPASQNGRPDPSPRNRRQSTTSQIQDHGAQQVTTDSQNGTSISSGNSQHKKSTSSWSSWLPNTKVLFGVGITLMFGISTWVYAIRAEKSAEQANQETAEGNRLAALGNRLTIWQLCNSEEEYQNTTWCADVMKNGPFLPEKRVAPRRMPARELRYPDDFDRFTRHHGLLAHLLARRIQLDWELHAFHKNSEEQQSLSKGSPRTESLEQFKRIADSILVSEGYISALLSHVHLSEEADEAPVLNTYREKNFEVSSSQSAKARPTTEGQRHLQTQTAFEFSAKSLGNGRLERRNRNDYIQFLSSRPWIILFFWRFWHRYCGRRLARSERLGHVVYTCFGGLWISAITYMFFFSKTWLAFVALDMLELLWRSPFFHLEQR